MAAWWPGISFSSCELVRTMHARYIGILSSLLLNPFLGCDLIFICMLKFFQHFSVQTCEFLLTSLCSCVFLVTMILISPFYDPQQSTLCLTPWRPEQNLALFTLPNNFSWFVFCFFTMLLSLLFMQFYIFSIRCFSWKILRTQCGKDKSCCNWNSW